MTGQRNIVGDWKVLIGRLLGISGQAIIGAIGNYMRMLLGITYQRNAGMIDQTTVGDY